MAVRSPRSFSTVAISDSASQCAVLTAFESSARRSATAAAFCLVSASPAYRCGMDLVITADAGDADTRQKAAAVALRRALDSNAVRTAHWLAESEIATVEKDRGDLTAIKELEERLEKSPLLVISELGVSRFTPFNFERFYFSINLRHSEGLRTIYTTPHKRLSDLTARWTEQGCGNPEQIDRICEILAKNATMV